MILKELLASTPIYEITGLRRVEITGLALHVEDVASGTLFIYHSSLTGIPYEEAVRQAVLKGAVAICIDQDQTPLPNNSTYIKTYHMNRFLSAVARNFYQNPSQSMNLVGVTGSHGKTTVGWMVQSVLGASGSDSIAMSMSRYQMASEYSKPYPKGYNSIAIHSRLRAAHTKNIRRGIIECSYTGIVEEILRHIRFNSLIYTDLYTYFQNQREDYHYFEIRKNLLDYLKSSNSPIIVNMDDFYAHELQHETIVSYGLFANFEVHAEEICLTPSGAEFTMVTPKEKTKMTLKVPGIHNVYNAMAACAWGCAEGLELAHIRAGLEGFNESSLEHPSEKLRGCMRIVKAEGNDLEGLKERYKDIKEQAKGSITTILCVGSHQDSGTYKALGKLISEYCANLIITSNYQYPHHSMDTAFAIAQGSQTPTISHEADNFKALQKAVSTGGDGDVIIMIL